MIRISPARENSQESSSVRTSLAHSGFWKSCSFLSFKGEFSVRHEGLKKAFSFRSTVDSHLWNCWCSKSGGREPSRDELCVIVVSDVSRKVVISRLQDLENFLNRFKFYVSWI